jgi:plastocyanin
MRKWTIIAATAALCALFGATVSTSASPQKARATNRITSIGSNSFVRNALIQSTLRFSPQRAVVNSGSTITSADRDRPKEPHTLSIVRRKARPNTTEQVFSCGACRVAGAHFQGQKPKIRVNEGKPGLNRPGDSILFLPGKSVSAKVTASAGKTLYYLCATHPWMQGRILVG